MSSRMETALQRIIQAHDELEAAKEELAAAGGEAGALGPVRGLDDTDDFAEAFHAGLDPDGPPSPAISPAGGGAGKGGGEVSAPDRPTPIEQHRRLIRAAWRPDGPSVEEAAQDPEAAALHREKADLYRRLAEIEEHLAALAEGIAPVPG